MRKQVTLIAALLLVAAGPVARAQSIPAHPREIKFPKLDYAPPKASTYRTVLQGGIPAYLVEDHELPLITVSVTIRTGSYLDAAGKTGLAGAVGSQLRSGGTVRWKAQEFDEEAEFLAVNISSFVGSTSGGATVNTLARNLDEALELYFEMLAHPAFQQDRLDLYKSQVLQAMERRNDSTEGIEGREWNRLLRGEKHFSSLMTTRASIQSLTREDLVAFHKKYYHPGNFIFAVSGDFRTADMKAKLEKALASWPRSSEAVAAVPKPDFTPVPGVYIVDKPEVNQGRVSIGHLGIRRGNPDEYALEVMNEILGGADFSSRITNRVRSDEGLAYSAGSTFTAGVYYEGTFRASFQSKSSTVAQAAQIVLDEIERMRKEKVTADELETIKNNLIEVFPRYFGTAAAIAGTFAGDEYTGRDPKYWETYRDRIRAVTADDVLRVAQKYLQPDRLVILVVGNAEEILKGSADRTEFSLRKLAKGGTIARIPLPDPNTMIYPK
jgi:zinc protease